MTGLPANLPLDEALRILARAWGNLHGVSRPMPEPFARHRWTGRRSCTRGVVAVRRPLAALLYIFSIRSHAEVGSLLGISAASVGVARRNAYGSLLFIEAHSLALANGWKRRAA